MPIVAGSAANIANAQNPLLPGIGITDRRVTVETDPPPADRAVQAGQGAFPIRIRDARVDQTPLDEGGNVLLVSVDDRKSDDAAVEVYQV